MLRVHPRIARTADEAPGAGAAPALEPRPEDGAAVAAAPFRVGWECAVTAHRALTRLAPRLADLPAALTAPIAAHPVVGIFERSGPGAPPAGSAFRGADPDAPHSSLDGVWPAFRLRIEALQRPHAMARSVALGGARCTGPADAAPAACTSSRPDIDEDEARELGVVAASLNHDSRPAAGSDARALAAASRHARRVGMHAQQVRKLRAALLARVEALADEFVRARNACDEAAESAFLRALEDEAADLRRGVATLGRSWFARELLAMWVRGGVLPQSAQQDPELARHAGRVELLEARMRGDAGATSALGARSGASGSAKALATPRRAVPRKNTGTGGRRAQTGPQAGAGAGRGREGIRQGGSGAPRRSRAPALPQAAAAAAVSGTTASGRGRATVASPVGGAAWGGGPRGAVAAKAAELASPARLPSPPGRGSGSAAAPRGAPSGLVAGELRGREILYALVLRALNDHVVTTELTGRCGLVVGRLGQGCADPFASALGEEPSSTQMMALRRLRAVGRALGAAVATPHWAHAGGAGAEASDDDDGDDDDGDDDDDGTRGRGPGRLRLPVDAASVLSEAYRGGWCCHAAPLVRELVRVVCSCPAAARGYRAELRAAGRAALGVVGAVGAGLSGSHGLWLSPGRAIAASECFNIAAMTLDPAAASFSTSLAHPGSWAGDLSGRPDCQLRTLGWQALLDADPEASRARSGFTVSPADVRSLSASSATAAPVLAEAGMGHRGSPHASGGRLATALTDTEAVMPRRPKRSGTTLLVPVRRRAELSPSPATPAPGNKADGTRTEAAEASLGPSSSADTGRVLSPPAALLSLEVRAMLDAALLARYPPLASLLDALTPSVLDASLDRLARKAASDAVEQLGSMVEQPAPGAEARAMRHAAAALGCEACSLVAEAIRPAVAGVSSLILDRPAAEIGGFVDCTVSVGVARVKGMVRARAGPVLRPVVSAALARASRA